MTALIRTMGPAAVVLLLWAWGPAASGQTVRIDWSALSSGSGVTTPGNRGLMSVAGQAYAGRMQGGNLAVGAGFLVHPLAPGRQRSVPVSLEAGWNLLSLPVIRSAAHDSVRQAYPAATYDYGFAYVPGSGYQQRFRLNTSNGYWIKFPAAGIPRVVGGALLVDTLVVQAGWNLVGSLSARIDTSAIISIPPGNRISPWFGFSGGLAPVDVLMPGHGYWVKADVDGMFILSVPWGAPDVETLTRP